MNRLVPLLLLFFASGASGLIYELVWIRQFGALFGSSVYSAALVSAVFLSGLGLGAWLMGPFSDRRFRADPVSPLRWYGRFELAIGALAALEIALLPILADVAAEIARYEEDAHGWLQLAPLGSFVRYAFAAILLLPITLLMGGTLTLLIRYVVGNDAAAAGWRTGLLYGVNTAGAALGCFLTDTALVPLAGIRGAQGIALSLNVFAAAGAWWLARRAEAPPAATPEIVGPARTGGTRVAWAAIALGFTGFAAMAMQIAWFRQFLSLFAAFRPVFSILLTVILVGIWLGSLAGGRLARRWAPSSLYALALAGFALSVVAGLGLLQHGEASFGLWNTADVHPAWRWPTLYARLLAQIAWVVGPPSFFAGAAFPLANAIAQHGRERVGARAGLLYLANTLGGVLGSLVAGFALLPQIGIQSTVAVVLACVPAALIALSQSVGWDGLSAPGRRLFAATSALALLALGGWSLLRDDFLLRRSLPLAPDASGRGVLAVHEGVNETIAVIAQAGPALVLLTNGHKMSATNLRAQRYMRAFAHVPLLLDDSVEKVMVMCFGVGNTLAATLQHPQVKYVDVVDLSEDVLAHSEHFAAVNGRPLDDPRVRVHVNDARHHLQMLDGEVYDLVTGEPPPLNHAGVVNLYTREFFELARSRLRPGGWITYWLPVGQLGEAGIRSLIRAFLDVFPESVLLSGYRDEMLLVGRKQAPIGVDPEAVVQRLAALPALRPALERIALDGVPELVGMLAATAPTLERAARGVPPLRDDRPALEYSIRSLQPDPRLPSDLVSIADVERWCPRCFRGALDSVEESQLRGYLEVMSLYYRSAAFLAGEVEGRLRDVELSEEAERAVAWSPYLQELLGELPPLHRQALLLEQHGRPRLAIERLRQLLRAEPHRARARADLERLRASAVP